MGERIGILGGTFDPIHIGHLAFAEAARVACGLDRVLVMPTCVSVYKLGQDVTPAETRLEMCRLACESNPAFEASSLEIDRGGKTYTADTLRELIKRNEEAELYFLVSADAAITVPKWRESDTIARLATIVTSDRPGTTWPEGITKERLDGRFRVKFVDAPQIDVASSRLREWARSGRPIRYLVPDAVFDYIEANGLYR